MEMYKVFSDDNSFLGVVTASNKKEAMDIALHEFRFDFNVSYVVNVDNIEGIEERNE